MWGCDYIPFSEGWRGAFFPGGILSLLVWGLVILLIVALVIRVFKSQAHSGRGFSQDRIDSLAILKTRFARGEISLEEFSKMRRTLSSL